jgi:hypothetical protein
MRLLIYSLQMGYYGLLLAISHISFQKVDTHTHAYKVCMYVHYVSSQQFFSCDLYGKIFFLNLSFSQLHCSYTLNVNCMHEGLVKEVNQYYHFLCFEFSANDIEIEFRKVLHIQKSELVYL